MAADPYHRYSNKSEKPNLNIFDDFKLKNPFGPHGLNRNISAVVIYMPTRLSEFSSGRPGSLISKHWILYLHNINIYLVNERPNTLEITTMRLRSTAFDLTHAFLICFSF